MSTDNYKKEAISYYFRRLKTLDKDDCRYKECIKKIEWLLRDDKTKPVAVIDNQIIEHCKSYLNNF